jgi:WD40 repeat protein
MIASVGVDRKIRRWEVATGKEVGSASEPGGNYLSVGARIAYLDSETLVTFGETNAVKCWDAATGKRKLEFTGCETGLTALAYAPDGRHVACSGHDSTIRIYEALSGKLVKLLENGNADVHCLHFSPDGGRIASGDTRGDAKVWSWMKDGAPATTFHETDTYLEAVAFSPDGTRIATGTNIVNSGDSGVVHVRELATGKLLHEIKDQKGALTSLVFAADGKSIFISSSKYELRRWDLPANREIASFKGDPVPREIRGPIGLGYQPIMLVGSLATSPAGLWLYSSGPGDRICVWEAQTGQFARFLREQQNDKLYRVLPMTVSPDGRLLAVACGNEADPSSVEIWDLPSGKKIATLRGHRGIVKNLAFSPDGRHLASSSQDTTVLIWDVARSNWNIPVPDEKTLAGIWAELGSSEPKVAYAAVCRGALAPDAAVRLLKVELKPVTVPDAAKVAALVQNLDARTFAEREKAAKELIKLGSGATAMLGETQKKTSSAEVQNRLSKILRAIEAGEVQDCRAIELLEMIGTPAAKYLLVDLSKGKRDATLTRQAIEALHRLDARAKAALR